MTKLIHPWYKNPTVISLFICLIGIINIFVEDIVFKLLFSVLGVEIFVIIWQRHQYKMGVDEDYKELIKIISYFLKKPFVWHLIILFIYEVLSFPFFLCIGLVGCISLILLSSGYEDFVNSNTYNRNLQNIKII